LINYIIIILVTIFIFFSNYNNKITSKYNCTSNINNKTLQVSFSQYQKLINSHLKNKIKCRLIFNENTSSNKRQTSFSQLN
jgi:hypothetical protein